MRSYGAFHVHELPFSFRSLWAPFGDQRALSRLRGAGSCAARHHRGLLVAEHSEASTAPYCLLIKVWAHFTTAPWAVAGPRLTNVRPPGGGARRGPARCPAAAPRRPAIGAQHLDSSAPRCCSAPAWRPGPAVTPRAPRRFRRCPAGRSRSRGRAPLRGGRFVECGFARRRAARGRRAVPASGGCGE